MPGLLLLGLDFRNLQGLTPIMIVELRQEIRNKVVTGVELVVVHFRGVLSVDGQNEGRKESQFIGASLKETES